MNLRNYIEEVRDKKQKEHECAMLELCKRCKLSEKECSNQFNQIGIKCCKQCGKKYWRLKGGL